MALHQPVAALCLQSLLSSDFIMCVLHFKSTIKKNVYNVVPEARRKIYPSRITTLVTAEQMALTEYIVVSKLPEAKSRLKQKFSWNYPANQPKN